VLKKIFGPKMEAVTGGRGRLHSDELYFLYLPPNIIWAMKSRRMTWTGHMARVGEGRGAKIVLVGKLKERDQLEDLAIDGRIILKWVFKK
jgi:hypothetical protein